MILICWQIAKIVASEQRCIHSIDCLNAADELEKKMTKKEAQEFLVKLAADKWLLNVSGRPDFSWETSMIYIVGKWTNLFAYSSDLWVGTLFERSIWYGRVPKL